MDFWNPDDDPKPDWRVKEIAQATNLPKTTISEQTSTANSSDKTCFDLAMDFRTAPLHNNVKSRDSGKPTLVSCTTQTSGRNPVNGNEEPVVPEGDKS